MKYNIFLYSIILIVIPLILLILTYRNYVYKYCKNDMKCLKKNLEFSLNNLNYLNDTFQVSPEKVDEEQIEGFFGGFGGWFSGSSPSTLPVSPGSLQNENLNTLEKKINDKMAISNKFPPTELNGNSDDFKDASNNDILKTNAIFNKLPIQPSIPLNKLSESSNKLSEPLNKLSESSNKLTVPTKPSTPNILNVKSLLGTCQFYNDKCPDKYTELGNFSIEGLTNSNILKCGNVQNIKPARAIAQIKNNFVYEIHVIDSGQGYNPKVPPKISIEGGKGHGCVAEPIIDDEGYLKLIKIINPGYNYTETPNIIIESAKIDISCHLCCKSD